MQPQIAPIHAWNQMLIMLVYSFYSIGLIETANTQSTSKAETMCTDIPAGLNKKILQASSFHDPTFDDISLDFTSLVSIASE